MRTKQNFALGKRKRKNKLRITIPYQDYRRKTKGTICFSNREPLKDAPQIQIIAPLIFSSV